MCVCVCVRVCVHVCALINIDIICTWLRSNLIVLFCFLFFRAAVEFPRNDGPLIEELNTSNYVQYSHIDRDKQQLQCALLLLTMCTYIICCIKHNHSMFVCMQLYTTMPPALYNTVKHIINYCNLYIILYPYHNYSCVVY